MHTQLIETPLAYTGSELRSHWIYATLGLQGDAAVAFAGPCEVRLGEMVDLADVQANAPISSEHMLSLIIEHFQADLRSMILRQRLLTAQAKDLLERHGVSGLRRTGDDLYDGGHKLSVSIATVSPVSGLIHFGINISSLNTPVATKGLEDY
ncbi:MAG: DUF366 domain-containing protein, partial [Candidatus Melainabacteria bacterium HGW-Melainabacteria-1]